MSNNHDDNQQNQDELLQQFSSSYGADALGGGVGLEGVRLSPSQHLGSPAVGGALQAALEIFQNSADESQEVTLFFKEQGVSEIPKFIIDVKITKDDEVTTRDTGRGVPVDYSEKFKRTAMEAMFEEINVGGKGKGYVKDGKSAYRGKTVGKHGTGAACANATSDYFEVDTRIRKDGQHWRARWEDGTKRVMSATLIGPVTDGVYGTTVRFRPSKEVFEMYDDAGVPQDRFFNFEQFDSIFTEYAYALENTVTNFTFEEADGTVREKSYDSEKYIPVERIKHNDEQVNVYEHTIVNEEHDYQMNIVVALTPVTRQSFLVSNMHRIQRGTTETALDDSMKNWLIDVERRTNELLVKEKIKDNISVSWLKKQHISAPLYYTSFYLLMRMGNPHYSGQSKEELRVPSILEPLTAQLNEAFENELKPFKDEVVLYLAKYALNRYKDLKEEEKRKQQKAQREKSRKDKEEMLGLNDKHRTRGMSPEEQNLITYARSKDATKTILYFVEGKSAKDAMDEVRDISYHTIVSIDQRPTNVFIHTAEQISEKEKFKFLFKQLYGTNEGNLKAVVISTDRDADGALIENYLIAFIYMYFPHYLTQGKVYIFDTPKYAADQGNKTEYFYSEEERDDFRKSCKNDEYNKPWVFYQFKGLGSIPSDLLREMVRTGSHFYKVNPDSIDEGIAIVESMLSDKRYKRRIVLDKYGDQSMLVHNALREQILAEHEIDFDINSIETQFSTTPNFEGISEKTFHEEITLTDNARGYTSLDEQEGFISDEGDDENLI